MGAISFHPDASDAGNVNAAGQAIQAPYLSESASF